MEIISLIPNEKAAPKGGPFRIDRMAYFIAMLAADSGSSSAKQRW
jgi:hypothetical protein